MFALLAAHDPVGVKGFRFVRGNKRQQTWLTFDNQIINLTFTESLIMSPFTNGVPMARLD